MQVYSFLFYSKGKHSSFMYHNWYATDQDEQIHMQISLWRLLVISQHTLANFPQEVTTTERKGKLTRLPNSQLKQKFIYDLGKLWTNKGGKKQDKNKNRSFMKIFLVNIAQILSNSNPCRANAN